MTSTLEINKVNLKKDDDDNQLQQLVLPLVEVQEKVNNGVHNYVNGNSVHFHRQESSNKNLEFQRENGDNLNNAKEKEVVKTIENEAKFDLNNKLGGKEEHLVIPRPRINNGNHLFDKTVLNSVKNTQNEFVKESRNEINNNLIKEASRRIFKKKRQRLEGGENHEDEENGKHFELKAMICRKS